MARTRMNPLMVDHFRFPGKRFTTRPTRERFIAGMDDSVHVQIMLRQELFTAIATHVLLQPEMDPLVLYQVVALKERRIAHRADKVPGPLAVGLHVHCQHVLGGEILRTNRTLVRPLPGVCVHVHL